MTQDESDPLTGIYTEFRTKPAPPEVAALMTLAEVTRRQSAQLERIAGVFERMEEKLTNPAYLVQMFRQMGMILKNLERADSERNAAELWRGVETGVDA